MAVQIDIEDILAGTIGRIVMLLAFFVSAIWLGSLVGAIAWIISDLATGGGFDWWDLRDLWRTPVLQLNDWLVLNVLFLAVGLALLWLTDSAGYAAWGILIGLESMFAMIGGHHDYLETRETVFAWVAWLVLLGMLETGIWLVRQMRMNRWARELILLKAENARLGAEREAAADGPGEALEQEDLNGGRPGA